MAVQLSAVLTGEDGATADVTTTVAWESSEADRARVDESGMVTAGIEPGNVVIAARVKDGRTAASALVEVREDSGAEVTVD